MTMGWQGLVRGESTSAAVTGPRVAASFPLGLRATLIERGDWTVVRAMLERRDLDASILLDTARGSEWIPLSAHVALVEATAELLGLEGTRELGLVRTQESTMGGLYPSLMRSWVRSFRDDPASLIRIGPQIWQMAFRDAGRCVVDVARPSGVSVHILDCEALATSAAWRAIITGFGVGVMRLAGLREHIVVTSDSVSATHFEIDWGGAPGS